MRQIGPADTPFLVPNAGHGAELRAGVSISVTILERLSPGLYRVLAGPKSLLASSEARLSPGSVFRARVEKGPTGSGLLLRLLPERGPEEALSSLLKGSGLPPDAASRAAALALLKSGEAPSAGGLGRVRRAFLSGGKGSPEERAEAAADLESKGLASSPEAVDALLDALGSGSSGGGSGRQGQHREDQRGEGRPGEPSEPASAGPGGQSGAVEAELPEPDLEPEAFARALGGVLKALCSRASPASAGPAAVLGLANHASSRGERLVELPFSFSLDRVAFDGIIRILLPYMPSGPGRFDARFTVSREGGAEGQEASSSGWAFSLVTGGGLKPALSLLPPLGREREVERFLPAFRAELEGIGCSLRLGGGEAARPEGLDLDA